MRIKNVKVYREDKSFEEGKSVSETGFLPLLGKRRKIPGNRKRRWTEKDAMPFPAS